MRKTMYKNIQTLNQLGKSAATLKGHGQKNCTEAPDASAIRQTYQTDVSWMVQATPGNQDLSSPNQF